MEATKARISFMSLSPELRNRVYDLTLIPESEGDGGVKGSMAIYIGAEHEGNANRVLSYQGPNQHESSFYTTDWRKQPALTMVSRFVRQETLPIYYGANEFLTRVSDVLAQERPEPREPRRGYFAVGSYVTQPKSVVQPKSGYTAFRSWLLAIRQSKADLIHNLTILIIDSLWVLDLDHFLNKQALPAAVSVPNAIITYQQWHSLRPAWMTKIALPGEDARTLNKRRWMHTEEQHVSYVPPPPPMNHQLLRSLVVSRQEQIQQIAAANGGRVPAHIYQTLPQYLQEHIQFVAQTQTQ